MQVCKKILLTGLLSLSIINSSFTMQNGAEKRQERRSVSPQPSCLAGTQEQNPMTPQRPSRKGAHSSPHTQNGHVVKSSPKGKGLLGSPDRIRPLPKHESPRGRKSVKSFNTLPNSSPTSYSPSFYDPTARPRTAPKTIEETFGFHDLEEVSPLRPSRNVGAEETPSWLRGGGVVSLSPNDSAVGSSLGSVSPMSQSDLFESPLVREANLRDPKHSHQVKVKLALSHLDEDSVTIVPRGPILPPSLDGLSSPKRPLALPKRPLGSGLRKFVEGQRKLLDELLKLEDDHGNEQEEHGNEQEEEHGANTQEVRTFVEEAPIYYEMPLGQMDSRHKVELGFINHSTWKVRGTGFRLPLGEIGFVHADGNGNLLKDERGYSTMILYQVPRPNRSTPEHEHFSPGVYYLRFEGKKGYPRWIASFKCIMEEPLKAPERGPNTVFTPTKRSRDRK